MNAPRVHLPVELAVGERLSVEGGVHRHLATVLRLSPGAEVHVFNGKGGHFETRVVAIERRSLILEPLRFDVADVESPLRITLVQAVSRGDRMDHTLQKAVELGVARVLPLLTRRSTQRFAADRQTKRMRHWQAVMVAACEQCGRNRIPALEQPQSLQTLLASRPSATEPWLVLHPGSGTRLSELERSKGAVTVVVGAEGGWEDRELDGMREAGLVAVQLGPRVLRTETAATVAIAALQLLWGDLG